VDFPPAYRDSTASYLRTGARGFFSSFLQNNYGKRPSFLVDLYPNFVGLELRTEIDTVLSLIIYPFSSDHFSGNEQSCCMLSDWASGWKVLQQLGKMFANASRPRKLALLA
jgi:hypothetical protein